MFRAAGEAPARVALIASVLERAGHEVVRRPLGNSPAALLGAVRDSPDVIHACGSDAWRAATLTARIARAAVVYEPLGERPGGWSRARPPRAVRLGRRGAVLARDGRQAIEIRSRLGLPYLPPVVADLASGGRQGERRMSSPRSMTGCPISTPRSLRATTPGRSAVDA